MSNLQENETGYQFAILDIQNAIAQYGIEIIADALSSYVIDNYDLDLTNIHIPDTMLVQ